MDRENFLLKRRIKYMILLFVIFMALIISFDLIVFNSTRDTLYEDCDHQLTEAKEHVLMNPESAIKNFLNGKQIVYHDNDLNYVISYKIFILVRNQDGAVLNADYLSAFSYMLDLKDPIEQEGRILTQRVGRNNETRYFRTYTFSVPGTEGDVYYIQAATDVTDLQMPLSIIVRVLLFCTLGATVVMILVGWYLSKSLVSGVVEAWKQQDEFISYASHEIRSPLAVVHSSLELLLETPGAKIIDRSELILNSLSETSRLRKMTNNLLEMVKLQTSELNLHKEEIQLTNMVEEFIEPFVYQAEATGRIFSYDVQKDLKLVADRQLLTELLVIFLENAQKYTNPGDRIDLNIAQEGLHIVIRVKDTGVGISDEAMTRIFTRFYREERHQTKSDGSGLGLYIASLIVQAHGGKIYAEQNKPKGTVFTASLFASERI